MSEHIHRHEPAPPDPLDRRRERRALALALGLTSSFTVAEVIGGILTGSLALIADAGHMLSDSASLALALFALWLAGRPAPRDRTFGYRRAEILAAFANGVALVAISIWIFAEAWRRFRDPPEVLGGWMLVVAILGLAVNVGATSILWRQRGGSLNATAAFRHVLSDLLGSVGAILAAATILATGWMAADPIVSVLVGLLVLYSSWSILRDSINVLMESSPEGVSVDEVRRRMESVSGVADVHDLHVWSITTGMPSLSAHVAVARGEDPVSRRRALEQVLAADFGIGHTTLQVEELAEDAGPGEDRSCCNGRSRCSMEAPECL